MRACQTTNSLHLQLIVGFLIVLFVHYTVKRQVHVERTNENCLLKNKIPEFHDWCSNSNDVRTW